METLSKVADTTFNKVTETLQFFNPLRSSQKQQTWSDFVKTVKVKDLIGANFKLITLSSDSTVNDALT